MPLARCKICGYIDDEEKQIHECETCKEQAWETLYTLDDILEAADKYADSERFDIPQFLHYLKCPEERS